MITTYPDQSVETGAEGWRYRWHRLQVSNDIRYMQKGSLP